MNLKLQVGRRIKELRQKRNLKQSELAEIVGVATKHQSCIETGRNFPSAELFEKYAVAFGMDVSEVLSLKSYVPVKSRTETIYEISEEINIASDYELFIIEKFIRSIISK